MDMSKTGTDQLQSQIRNDIFINMNAVGIGISKRKSTAAIRRSGGTVVAKPFDAPHLSADFQSLKKLIRYLNGETCMVMECTGHYYKLISRELSQAVFL